MFVKASLVPCSTFRWRKGFCQTLSQLNVPEGYCSNMRNLVSMEDLKLYGLKSHDYHTLMQQLLPMSLRSLLPKHYFPPSFFDIMLHLTVHLVREVRLCGLVYLRLMYPFERFMKEAIEFCIEYLSNVDAIEIPISANIDQKLGHQYRSAIGNNEPISETLKWIAHGPSHYIRDLDYTMFRIPVFKCDWVDNKNGIKVDDLGFKLVDFSKIAHKSDPFILAS
ncbi:hypothetical protein AAG906_029336 [Vitis piasezkii]